MSPTLVDRNSRSLTRFPRQSRSTGPDCGSTTRNADRAVLYELRRFLAEIQTRRVSLKHRDWDRAKRQADKIAAGLAEPTTTDTAEAKSESLTLETLFDIYGDEVTPTKSKRSRNHDRAMMRRFLRFFGKHRKAETLSQRDWDRFIRARRAGRAGGSRRPVSERTIEYDLRLLLAVLNWAAKSRDEEGRLLLESNPLRGLKLPKEKNPRRVVLTQAEYEALLRVSAQVDWRFRVALVLAHETGQRIAGGANRGKESSKFNSDCMICRPCRHTNTCSRRPE